MKIRSLEFGWLIAAVLIVGIGVFRWIAGSHKCTCTLNTRNVQQAMRSYQGMNNLPEGSPLPKSALIGPGKLIQSEPLCPSGDPYHWSPFVQPQGKLILQCTHPTHQLDPATIKDW